MRAALEHAMHEVWSHRGLTASLLYPFSLIYLAVARAKARKTVPVELPVPVVVGNIYVGGTGKTPITIELVRELRTAGFTPGVISRGYGRASNELHLVEEESPAGEVGDEPLLIRRATGVPVAVGRDRVAAGRLLIEKNPQVNVIVSDDGLQHPALCGHQSARRRRAPGRLHPPLDRRHCAPHCRKGSHGAGGRGHCRARALL